MRSLRELVNRAGLGPILHAVPITGTRTLYTLRAIAERGAYAVCEEIDGAARIVAAVASLAVARGYLSARANESRPLSLLARISRP
jgi:hypothetical protein